MAHELTTDEKTNQRKQRQWARTFLAIPEYHTIYTAQLMTVPTINDMVISIAFNSGSGTLANVLADMTLYVGTAAGAYDLGMCRIRKAPIAGTFYVNETSEIDWNHGGTIYLTVVDDYSLWQKSIKVEPVRMDADITYSDQHEDFDPVPAMGGHRVKKLVGEDVDVILGPAADTPAWVIGSTIASRLWTCTGATFDNAAAVNPVATFTAPGTYLAYCTFTAANGKTFRGVRYVIIYDDDNPLISDFQLNAGSFSLESGGGSFDITLFNQFTQGQLRERTLVILCTEDYAGTESNVLPHQITGSENILGHGWISDIDTEFTSQMGLVSFTVESAAYWLKQIRDYPSGLKLKPGTATSWVEMPTLTVKRALWHFLHWRSTATRVMDIQITDDTRLASRYETARANLWERLVQVAQPTIYARPYVDPWSRLFVEIEPQMEALADRDFTVVMEIEEEDIVDTVRWIRKDVKPLSMLFWSGIAVNYSGGASSFFSMSPGHAYGHHGEEEPQDNYLVSSQAKSNSMCACYFGWRNRSPYDIQIDFTHSMRIVGIFPRQYFYLDLDPADDPRGLGFTGNLVPREILYNQNPDTKFIDISVVFEPESEPGLSINGDIPTMEDIDFSVPDLPDLPGLPSLPPLPAIPLPPTVQPTNQPVFVVIVTDTHGIFYTDTFDLEEPLWYDFNAGLDASQMIQVGQLFVVPSGKVYIMTDGNASDGWQSIMCAQTLGAEWVEVFDADEYPESNSAIFGMGISFIEEDTVAFWGGRPWSFPTDGNTGDFTLAVGNSGGFSFGTFVSFPRGRFSSVMFSNEGWNVYTKQGTGILGNLSTAYFVRFDADGDFIVGIQMPGANGATDSFGIPAGDLDLNFYWEGGALHEVYAITDDGATQTLTGIETQFIQGIATSPTGVVLMGKYEDGIDLLPSVSLDGGATWTDVSAVIPVGQDVWENCRDDWRFIFALDNTIGITMDQGTTMLDKTGNLNDVVDTPTITIIRHII